MTASICRIALATVAAAALGVAATPAAAIAADASGRDFGQHVRTCAQSMGFSGDHNPGMHSGYAGWDGMTSQM